MSTIAYAPRPFFVKKTGEPTATIKNADEQAAKKNWIDSLYLYKTASELTKGVSLDEGKIIQNWNESLKNRLLGLTYDSGEKVFDEKFNYENSQYAKIKLEVKSEDNKQASKYEEILAVIKSGNPWLGKFDDFSRYDGWKELLASAEKYFSENPSFIIEIVPLSKKSVDYKTKTYTYSFQFAVNNNYFFSDVMNSLKAGLAKVWNEQWTDIPER